MSLSIAPACSLKFIASGLQQSYETAIIEKLIPSLQSNTMTFFTIRNHHGPPDVVELKTDPTPINSEICAWLPHENWSLVTCEYGNAIFKREYL